jgi:Uri superfamily endonuclease
LFPAGDYIYVGSAFGPGGLRTRLGRHLRGDGHPHWHIDTLRAAASVVGYVFAIADQPVECRWSQALAALPQARIPAPGFGSSDCRSGCQAHLIAFPVGSDLRRILTTLVPAPDGAE